MSLQQQNSSDSEAMSEINVTPLVDVMLVLLVIFIVTAPLLTQSMHLELPKTAPTSATLDNPHLKHIDIDAEGRIYLDKAEISGDALDMALRTALTADQELGLQLSADQAVPYGKVARVLAAAQHVGISKLSMVTIEE